MILAAFIAGVAPAFLLVFYIYMLDRNQREPLPWILRAVGYGLLSALLAILIEAIIPQGDETTLGDAIYNGFLVAALPEEAVKLLCLCILLRRNPHFDERMDCIVYAACVGMGFAAIENVGYLIQNADSMAETAIARALLSVPAHFFFAVFMGYFMSLAIWGRPEWRQRNWVLTLVVPVILHGVYDASLMSMPVSDYVMAVAVFVFIALGLFVWIGGHRRIARVLARDKRRMPHVNPLMAEGRYNKTERSTLDEASATVVDSDGEYVDYVEVSGEAQYGAGVDDTFDDEADSNAAAYKAPEAGRGLFRRPFSFSGRISRKEYLCSYIIYWTWGRLLEFVPDAEEYTTGQSLFALFLLVTFVPVVWFFLAQSVKRSHDTGHSGLWVLVPFYVFYLLFANGDSDSNEYGPTPA